jgi:hypothetical protein
MQYGALSDDIYIFGECLSLGRDSRESSQVFVVEFQAHEGRVCSAPVCLNLRGFL